MLKARRLSRPAVLVALLALLIQAFVVQTHIHLDADDNAAVAAAGAPNTPQDLSDLSALASGSDIDHCLLCHEQMSGGRALAIDAVHLLPPNAAIFVALYAEALSAAYGIISHSWQGRGPPGV